MSVLPGHGRIRCDAVGLPLQHLPAQPFRFPMSLGTEGLDMAAPLDHQAVGFEILGSFPKKIRIAAHG